MSRSRSRISPARGTLKASKTITVRWRASDRDHDALRATIQLSTNDGKTWRTVLAGAQGDHATLARGALTGTKRGRVRVVVDDGFRVARSTSKRLRIVG